LDYCELYSLHYIIKENLSVLITHLGKRIKCSTQRLISAERVPKKVEDSKPLNLEYKSITINNRTRQVITNACKLEIVFIEND
jgi:3-phosphoglycerate kinase